MWKIILFFLMGIVCFFAVMDGLLASGPNLFPTQANPLLIDDKNKRVLIYAELNLKNIDKPNPHWGVVYTGGKLADKAIIRAFCDPLEFHDALVQIGAKPGNNLTSDTVGDYVRGDALGVSVTWAGLNKTLFLSDIIQDSSGRRFQIRFGGNKKAAAEEKTGCITCLESCPVGITSNAAYPAIGGFKRFISPNSHFKGKTEMLPQQGGIILIYGKK